MARRKRKSRATRRTPLSDRFDTLTMSGALDGDGSPFDAGDTAETTGRRIVTVADTDARTMTAALRSVQNASGMADVCRASDFAADAFDTDEADAAEVLVLDELGVIVLNGDQDQQMAMASAVDTDVISEPEYWNYPLELETADLMEDLQPDAETFSTAPEYLRGYRRGVNQVIDALLAESDADIEAAEVGATDQSMTWGLRAIRAHHIQSGGRGIKVAVLDSGMDMQHPDFQGRNMTARSFIPANEPDNQVQDTNGHGTHCVGTACGPLRPGVGPRYGVAHEADIFVGKVLRQGPRGASGADGWILAGLNWALRNGCEVISMSLGSRGGPDFPRSYERAASIGLRRGSLVIAATGNSSDRARGVISPVGRPANCPSIVGVGAVDRRLRVANFSNGQRFGNGGEVNFVGPGVGVLSSVPMPARTGSKSGTSMATPHVSGIAAVLAATTGQRGVGLYHQIRNRARPLGPRKDYGNGLAELV